MANSLHSCLKFEEKLIYKISRHFIHKYLSFHSLKSPKISKIFEDAFKSELCILLTILSQDLHEVNYSIAQIVNDRLTSHDFISPIDVWHVIKKLSPGNLPSHNGIYNSMFKIIDRLSLEKITRYLRITDRFFLLTIKSKYSRNAFFRYSISFFNPGKNSNVLRFGNSRKP